jgi:hypothetical protein
MAAHQWGVREVPAISFNLPPQIDQNKQGQQDSLPLLSEVIMSNSDNVLEAELKREADRQTLFQKVANGILGSPNGYREVEVLIIRWDESIDQFKGHTQEVRNEVKLILTDGLPLLTHLA